jgi:hypothetical protein
VKMRHAAENVLRQRFCRWQECGTIFWICRSCDRGQCYCSDHCRSKARREQRCAANLRHRKTLEGRLDQRDRQKAYRQRLAAISVMDQGSPKEPSAGNIISPVHFSSVAAGNGGKQTHKTRVIHDSGVPHCILCGRAGQFVNPFHARR